MTDAPHAPDGLPRLSRGTHLGPEAGACFMEYVSLLAGEPWSDQPRCTHPVLAEVARVVNDSTTQAGRDRLVPLLPEVIGRTSQDPRTSPAMVDRLLTEAERLGLGGPVLRWHRQRARRRLERLDRVARRSRPRSRLSAVGDLAYQEGPAVRAVDAVAHAVCRLPDDRRDDALLRLLTSAIGTVPAGAGQERLSPGPARRPRREPTTPR